MRLDGHIDLCEAGRISGWARDADVPGAMLALEVFIGPESVGRCVANRARPDLRAAGKGDCGFDFIPPAPLAPGARDRVVLRADGSTLVLVNNYGGPQPDPFALPAPAAGTRFRRAVLHIGTEKTGSTSLQRFLAVNRPRLMDAGVYVPHMLAPAPDLANHSDLVLAAMADWRLDDGLRVARGIADMAALEALRVDLAVGFADEMAAVPAHCTTLFISSEHCHSRLLLLHEVAAVRCMLASYCAEIEIWVYLRPQHALAASQYAMHLLAGVPDAEMLPRLPYPDCYTRPRITSAEYFDYAHLLSRWAAIFGRAQMRPVLVEAGGQAGFNVIDDALERLDLAGCDFVPVGREATNVSAQAQLFLMRLNRAMAEQAPEDSVWAAQWVAERLRRSAPGQGVQASRAEILAFMAQFAASNSRVWAEWFPERAALFEAPPVDAVAGCCGRSGSDGRPARDPAGHEPPVSPAMFVQLSAKPLHAVPDLSLFVARCGLRRSADRRIKILLSLPGRECLALAGERSRIGQI